MKAVATGLLGVTILEPRVFGDERGCFYESWNQRALDEALGQSLRFVQDNHSMSQRGVLRGLHYQLEQPQGKLVRVVRGRVFDVAVDLRRSSATFGQWTGVELSAENRRQLWIAPGLAHGFLVLSGEAEFLYKTTDYYAPASERTLAWDDPAVGIEWPLHEAGGVPRLSAKDAVGRSWGACDTFS